MFLAFGCNVVLTVWPRSMEVGIGNSAAMLAVKLEDPEGELYTIADPSNAEVEGGSGWIAEGANVKGEDETTTTAMTTNVDPPSLVNPKKGKVAAKPPRPSFMITLVHGDHVVFYGDDFEVCMLLPQPRFICSLDVQYSAKREGTSFREYCSVWISWLLTEPFLEQF